MWLLSKWSAQRRNSTNGQQATEPSKIVRLLLRKRYSKLGPAGDYAPGNRFGSFRFGTSRKSKLGDGTSGNQGNEHTEQTRKVRRSASTSSATRSAMEKFSDAYVHIIWSAASHAVKPIGAKPKVPMKRAVTFEKMFGEPHDTVLRARSLSSLHSQLVAATMTAQVQLTDGEKQST